MMPSSSLPPGGPPARCVGRPAGPRRWPTEGAVEGFETITKDGQGESGAGICALPQVGGGGGEGNRRERAGGGGGGGPPLNPGEQDLGQREAGEVASVPVVHNLD